MRESGMQPQGFQANKLGRLRSVGSGAQPQDLVAMLR